MHAVYFTDQEYQALEKESQNLGISIKDYLIGLMPKKQEKPVYLMDLLKDLPKSQLTKSGLEIQQELRNEWD